MNDKAFEKKVNRDIENTKEDIAVLADDGATVLSRKYNQLENGVKTTVTEAVKTINKGVEQGLSQFNTKFQDVADRVPGDFSDRVANYPWVTIALTLALGLFLGALLKPGR